MPSLADIQRYHGELLDCRYNGVRRTRDSSGEEIEFRSDAELARAIAAVERQITDIARRRPTTVRFSTSKGL